jgi:alkylation response protein AidB-like acyl-CoA dehydrogenase
MASTYFSRRNLDFTLFEVLNVEELTQHEYFNAHDRETFKMTLDAATEIGDKILRPAYVEADRKQPELINGQVTVHPAVGKYVKAFGDAGLLGAPFKFELGGQQLPEMMFGATDFITGAANNSFVMFTGLTAGAAGLITTFGTQELIEKYALKMLTGEWTGTMCLTEPQAGSSLSDVATMAYAQADGSYKIQGQKIFISAGDHDITDNIIHLVLARLEGAPKGTRGISLFVVPKNRITTSGSLEPNDVTSMGIYHKMGQKGTPAMHLSFGEKNDSIGYMVGEPNKGLTYMFQMMNGARLGVGLAGVYIASAAYCESLQYAKERPQGRRLNSKDPNAEPVTIIHHPDVRRMLLSQKAFIEGTLSFVLQCHKYADLLHVSQTPEDKQYYDDLLELLTPVAKTYGAEGGIASVNQGVQILGGYGYTEDFVLEQMARDVRIMTLYEGTTGIQSQALLGRQIPRNNGRGAILWGKEVMKDIEAGKAFESLKPYTELMMKELGRYQQTTMHLMGLAAKGDYEVFLADATLYMEYFGILNVAWQWLKQGIVAQKALDSQNLQGNDEAFYQSKLQTMKYYFHYEVPKVKGLATRLTDNTVLTVLKDEDAAMGF